MRRHRGPVEPRHPKTSSRSPARRPTGPRPGHRIRRRVCRSRSKAGSSPEPLIAEVTGGGAYGFGRLDMVENRRVGIKSREVYECPGALALLMAHRDLEDLTLERDLPTRRPGSSPVVRARLRRDVVLALEAGARRLHRRITASRDRRGPAAPSTPGCGVVGPSEPGRLYDHGLATYDAADTFRHEDAEGFVRLWGLGVATWAARRVPRVRARPSPRIDDPLGGPPGRRDRGRGDGLLPSLQYDRRLAPDDLEDRGHTSAGSGVGGPDAERGRRAARRLSTRWSGSSTPEPSTSLPGTRTSTPRSSAASPRSPATPARSSTPVAAGTTRSPPTRGCTSPRTRRCAREVFALQDVSSPGRRSR